VANKNVESLIKMKKSSEKQRYSAGHGGNSRTHRLMGEPGKGLTIQAPVGVTVVTDQGEQVGDLYQHGDKVLVARGGFGGNELTNFMGLPGQARSVKLDLKLIADVGFVGFPNAGKSTLLKAISRARPKIASYPFTTIKPNLGVAKFDDLREISFADLPGLIEGAHINLGMGHKFLKHVERTRALLFVVDINGFQFKADSPYRTPAETVHLLMRELELYKEDLMEKPAVCVVTKMDTKGAKEKLAAFKEELEKVKLNRTSSTLPKDLRPGRFINFDEIIPISAKFSPKSVTELKFKLRDCIDEYDSRRTEENLEMAEEKFSQFHKSSSIIH